MRDDKVVVFDGVELQLASIDGLDLFAVALGEFSGDIRRGSSHFEDESERAHKQDGNNRVSDHSSKEVVSCGEDTVLPDDIGRLGRLLEFHALAEELRVGFQLKSHVASVLFLKSDEAGCGSGQRLKVLKQLIDNAVLSLHAVELLQGNLGASVSECVDELGIVVCEDYVGNGNVFVEFLRLGRPAMDANVARGHSTVDLSTHGSLDLLSHGALQAECRCVALLVLAASLFIDHVVPLGVGRSGDLELDGVVTSGNSR
mmetsp:Transcript_3109/g.3645  ORF Transcript_3109/g.3645 Transcript_3109/m.3645 type:complete len:258 (-) Transcript_3109:972-1745(-)